MPNIAEMLQKATAILRESGLNEPRREAASLLAFALKKDRTFLLTHDKHELSSVEESSFETILERRAQREPLQYITGRQEFYGLDFAVAPGVLIPRPETEMIVENAIEILGTRNESRFCEIGTGSGCISTAILYNVKTATAVGLDVSEKALEITRKNAENNGVESRLSLRKSDVFASLDDEKFDLLVSNPPYISLTSIAGLQPEVRDFEPLNALTDGADGLSIIERIVAGAPQFLKPEGSLLMEIGFGQAAVVGALFDAQIWRSSQILPDLQGIPRMVKAQII